MNREVARLASREEAEGLIFTLNAVDIEAELLFQPDQEGPAYLVLVPEAQEAAARQIVAEELGSGTAAASEPPAAAGRGWPGGLLLTLGLSLLLILCFVAEELLGGSQQRATLLRFGASSGPAVLVQGEWWRTLTAPFLHIGAQHLLANLVSLFALGAVSRFGPGRLAFFWLVSAAAGNWASLALQPGAVVRAGASGGIFGLFGALAGARLRQLRGDSARAAGRPRSRFKPWHVAAATLAFLGLTVASGPVDHPAHLGGLLGGALLGFLLPPPLDPSAARRQEWALGLLAAGLALLAGSYALQG